MGDGRAVGTVGRVDGAEGPWAGLGWGPGAGRGGVRVG